MRSVLNTLCMAAAALLLFGLVLVYTASSAQRGGAAPVLLKQVVAAAAGLAMGVFCAAIDYGAWRRRDILWTLSVLAIAASLMVFFGEKVNGSRRWISLPGFTLQPSEFSRIAMLVAMAAWYGGIGLRAREFARGVVMPGLVFAAFAGPVAASPDVGATMVMCAGAGAIMLAAGVKWRWLAIGAIAAIAIVAAMLASNDNKRARVMVTVNRMRGVETAGNETAYHVEQSLEAFARGGLVGRGIGLSTQKYYRLPEANSDFIYAIAAEEFGIAATASMVIAYMTLLVCGTCIAFRARDRVGSVLARGLTVTLAFEAAFNVGMVTGILPTKGIALPFASAGGSSLMASMVIIGLLVSIGAASIENPGALKLRDAQIEY